MLTGSVTQLQKIWLSDEKFGDTAAGTGTSLRREIETLFRSRRFIAGWVAVAVSAVSAYNYGTRPLYEAVAVVSMDRASAPTLSSAWYADEFRRKTAVEYQIELLKSPELARYAVTDAEPELAAELEKGPLGNWHQRLVEEARTLLGFPRRYGTELPAFATAFRTRLTVLGQPPSTWVYIGFKGYDPEAAALAIQRLIDVYLVENKKRTEGYLGESQEDLDRRLTERKGEVVATLGQLKEFEKKEGVQDVETARQALTKELARLQDSLVTVRQTVMTRKALVDETATLSPEGLLAIPAMRDDAVVSEAMRSMADLNSRIARQSATLGERHPDLVALRAELDVVRERRDGRLGALQEATDREYRLAAREESDINAMVRGTKRRLAALDENAVQRSFIQRQAAAGERAVGELIDRQVRQADSEMIFEPSVLQAPAVSTNPVSPQKGRNLLYALGIGLLSGVLLSWLRAHLDETLKTPEDIEAHFELPLLAMVPLTRPANFDLLGPEEGCVVRLFEAYRVLRTNLTLGPESPEKHPKIVITSARAGDGKSTTSCGLAVALARAGLRVLLIDGDLRRASLSKRFLGEDRPGLSDAVDGKPVRECVASTAIPGLSLLPAGTVRTNPAELLNRDAFPKAIDAIRSDYDWILCDAPPVLAVTDAAILARRATSVVLVIGANATPAVSVRATLKQLDRVGARLSGLVLNGLDLSRDSHYYRYYYGDRYEDYSKSPGRRTKG